jgi:hypothetical protein
MFVELFIVLTFGFVILIVPIFNLFDGSKQKKIYTNPIGNIILRIPHSVVSVVIAKTFVSPLESLKTMSQLGDNTYQILTGGIVCIITGNILLCFIESLKVIFKLIFKEKNEWTKYIIDIIVLTLLYPLSTVYIHILSGLIEF